MTAARPSRARRSRMASATARAAARPIMGRLGKTSTRRRPQARTRAPVRSVARRPRSSSAAQRRKCGSATSGSSISGCQRFSHSKETQRSPPAARSQSSTRAAGKSPRPGRTGGHGIFPSGGRRSSFRWTWRRKGPSAAAPGLGLLPELREGVGRVPHRAEPLASRLLEERRASRRPVAKSPCVSSQTSTPRAAEAVAQLGEATPRSRRGSRRGPPPAARGRRRRGCRAPPGGPRPRAVRSASSTAWRRAAGSGEWKNERVSTQGTARPASARRASVSRRPEPVSSGRAQSASSPSTKRSSTPS